MKVGVGSWFDDSLGKVKASRLTHFGPTQGGAVPRFALGGGSLKIKDQECADPDFHMATRGRGYLGFVSLRGGGANPTNYSTRQTQIGPLKRPKPNLPGLKSDPAVDFSSPS